MLSAEKLEKVKHNVTISKTLFRCNEWACIIEDTDLFTMSRRDKNIDQSFIKRVIKPFIRNLYRANWPYNKFESKHTDQADQVFVLSSHILDMVIYIIMVTYKAHVMYKSCLPTSRKLTPSMLTKRMKLLLYTWCYLHSRLI